MGGKRKEYGLGSFPEITLAVVRDRARELKEMIRDDVDPIEQWKAKKSALIADQRRGLIFEVAVDKYLDAKLDEFSNPKHRQQWRNTLKTYAVPAQGNMLAQDITVQDIRRVSQPIWHQKTVTAKRVRGRVEAV